MGDGADGSIQGIDEVQGKRVRVSPAQPPIKACPVCGTNRARVMGVPSFFPLFPDTEIRFHTTRKSFTTGGGEGTRIVPRPLFFLCEKLFSRMLGGRLTCILSRGRSLISSLVIAQRQLRAASEITQEELSACFHLPSEVSMHILLALSFLKCMLETPRGWRLLPPEALFLI